MAERIFQELIKDQALQQRHLCVGLDTDIRRIHPILEKGVRLPSYFRKDSDLNIVNCWNLMVIEATRDIAAAYKPNRAFYTLLGHDSLDALQRTVWQAWDDAPQALVILDAKYGDIDNTNDGYVYEAYNLIGADAVTLQPYMGHVAMAPFLDRKDKGNFVLVRTSNKGGGEFQDLEIGVEHAFFYNTLAQTVARDWNYNENCGVVAGATYPDEASYVREIVGSDMSILIPGVGAQGGTASEITPLALRKGQLGFINSSRGIIFATPQEDESQFDAIRREALKLHQEILTAQNTTGDGPQED